MTLSIAIANAKGGVAKTTTALSLSAALTENGRNVLAVDLDPHANLTISLGYKPNGLSPTVADVFLGDCQIERAIYDTPVERLSLIPSNHTLTMAENHLMVRDRYQLILRDALSKVSSFDIVMLDCPPTLGTLTQNALSAANVLIIPAQPEYYSAHALRDMLNLILAIRQRNNPKLRYRILLTMLDMRNRIHRSLAKQIRTAFSQAVFETEIEIDTRLRESPLFGQPIQQYAPTSRASQQYQALAKELRNFTHELD
ncbi:MAG: ParA family protein [Anaerolineales bacterium]|jgi:chromosome partitioning protein